MTGRCTSRPDSTSSALTVWAGRKSERETGRERDVDSSQSGLSEFQAVINGNLKYRNPQDT